MNRKLSSVFGIVVVLSMLLAACAPAASTPAAPNATSAPAAGSTSASSSGAPNGNGKKVVNLINGVLGDKSFFDSSNRGATKSAKDYNLSLKTIELGVDPAKWQPGLQDAAANENYDLMIVGTTQMQEYLQKLAPQYPDKQFIIYDTTMDYTVCPCKNVYSMTYKQNEGSYLAGLYAGLMTKTKTIGAIGGQDIPVIDDFIIGYKQGAAAAGIDASHVIVQFAGGWNDPAKGKEIALAMYQQGADIVFNIAGGTGVGIFQAAQEANKWAIGVDSDQAAIIQQTNPDQAKHILTSMQKNVDNSIYRALGLWLQGKLPFGTHESLGLKEGGVSLSDNSIYESNTPADVKDKIKQATQDIIDGKITVDTVFKNQ